MIKVTIQEAGRRLKKIKNGSQFARSVGYTRPVGTRIWNGDQEPRLNTLDKICKAWKCDLSDLVRYKPDPKPAPGNGLRKQKPLNTK